MAPLRYLLLAALQAIAVLPAPTAGYTPPHPPAPTGPYTPGVQILPLTDWSRRETLVNTSAYREILVSIYYPADVSGLDTNATTLPYMPGPTARELEIGFGVPNGTLAPLYTNSYPGAPLDRSYVANSSAPLDDAHTAANASCNDANVLIFSPGFTGSRLIYQTFAEQLASLGNIVVAIDHPYDALAVTFPDGHVVLGNTVTNASDADTLDYYNTRVADILFVTEKLPFLAPITSTCGVSQIGLYGHSLGGASAAGAMAARPGTYAGGVNLDGTFFGVPAAGNASADVEAPFLLMNHPGHSSANDTTWAAFEHAQTGWLKELSLNGSMHSTYTDIGIMVEALNLTGVVPEAVLEPYLGTIEPARAMSIVETFLRDFFLFAFEKKSEGVLEGPSKEFPEISFVYQNSAGY